MRKILSLIVMAIAFAIQLPAQTTVTVGNENSAITGYGPVNSFFNNSFSEVVYLSSELQAGTIISISYQYAASEPLFDPAPTIYMAEVPRTAFSSSTDWETATMTQVYSGGSVTYSQGWVTIFLTTPFEYSGTGNLVVAYNSQRDHYFGYRYFTHTSTTGSRMLMHYDDYDAVSGYNCTYSGTTYNQIPNTRFVILGEGEEYCFPATGLAAQNILSDEATLTWNISDASSTTFGLDYKLSSEEEWTTASTSITDTFYTLTALTSLTNYDFRVYAICSEENSDYSSGTFLTPPTENDCLPIPTTETFDDSENMTTWITMSNSPNNWYIGAAENSSTGDDVYNLTFDWKCMGSVEGTDLYGGIAVLLQNQSDPMPTDGNFPDEDNVVALLYGENAWTDAQIELPQVSGEKRLLFLAFGYYDNVEATAPAAIDNISITAPASGCPAPQNVNVTDITDNSAEITWSGTASSYEVRLNGAAAEIVTTTSKSFTNLTANTTYTAEVRAMCENNNSAWVSTTFTTLAEQGGVVPPTVATLAATSVTHNSATLNGTITAGSETITAQGFMYKTTAAADWTSVSASGTTMTATVNGLSAETEYQFKAFATTASGTVEGAAMSFTTTAAPVTQPAVTTLAATGVTHEVATLNGTVTTGSEAISAQGFMYKATTAADWTTVAATGETMSATINGLSAETAYEYKAFATTASGTVEGAVVNFTTLAAPATQPTVVTLEATEITHEAATLNGTIAAGSEAITAQGFMYKATTAADWTTVAAEGTAITATISGLSAETEYEYKAFATTESGTVEGNVVLFTTLANSGLSSAEGAVATMTVYPNPASERAIVAVNGVENGAKIVVSDMQGRIILTDTMAADIYELSVANMTSGVYYIRVIGATSTHTQKLIVE